jgi:glycosyltransferase involved in cell wall biosynthesis
MARLSVVIPAHNEGALIERLLGALTRDPAAEELEIVVIPNGCSDDTVARAKAVDPRVVVRSIPTASKIAALREADRVASTFPRVYVDADVRVDAACLLDLADALTREGGPLVASPRVVVDSRGASWWVRQYFRIWELTDYRRQGHIGSGVYALSAAGRARFADWPDVIADDRFVQRLFLPHERLTLPASSFTVASPRTLRAHIRRRTRIARGNLELPRTLQHAAPQSAQRHQRLAGRALRRPGLWPALLIYVVSTGLAILKARWEMWRHSPAAWRRDETTRSDLV